MNEALRDLVEQRIGTAWQDWAKDHPNLAAAIDRERLISAAVRDIEADAEFQRALSLAELDEQRLRDAARLLGLVERLIGPAFPWLVR